MTLPPFYAILDAEVCGRHGWTVPELARACLAGGARLLQVRGKRVPSGPLLDMVDEVVTAAAACDALVIVNDRADIARLARAGGVHVGQDDLPAAEARTIVGPSALVGLSTHLPALVDRALTEPISYVAVGPVFATATKDTGCDPVGLELVRYAFAASGRALDGAGHRVPVVAIGGITLDRAAAVLDAGADSVSVVSDLFATGDPEARTRQYVERLAGHIDATGLPD